MEEEARELAQLSAQLADPARATMIMSLMDGGSRLAGELGLTANVSPSSASGHLAKLVSSRILTDSRQGRHKYYRIATAAVAHAIEALQIVASPGTVLRQVGQSTLNPFAFARTCYDHLAGRLGVEVTAALQRQKASASPAKATNSPTEGVIGSRNSESIGRSCNWKDASSLYNASTSLNAAPTSPERWEQLCLHA